MWYLVGSASLEKKETKQLWSFSAVFCFCFPAWAVRGKIQTLNLPIHAVATRNPPDYEMIQAEWWS